MLIAFKKGRFYAGFQTVIMEESQQCRDWSARLCDIESKSEHQFRVLGLNFYNIAQSAGAVEYTDCTSAEG